MATTEDTPALEAAADCESVTLPKKPAESTAVSTPMALLLLGDDLAGIDHRVLVLQAREADSAKRIGLAGLYDAVQRAISHYKQIDGDLVRKALGG